MLKRIVLFGMLLCLFIAIPLALLGIRHVDLGQPFLSFMRAVNQDLIDYKIAIPNIPEIPSTNQFEGAWLILDVIIKFFNFIIKICNLAITVMNVIIQVVQMIFLIFKHLITFKDTLAHSSGGAGSSVAVLSALL